MPKTAIFLSDDSVDILRNILDNHERHLRERDGMPPFSLQSAINDVETIRMALPEDDS
jgi:hypothetical protein